jgi:hypothetical protein
MKHQPNIDPRDLAFIQRRGSDRSARLTPRDLEALTGADPLMRHEVETIMWRAVGLSRADLVEALTGVGPTIVWFKAGRQRHGIDGWPVVAVLLALAIARKLGACVDGLDAVLEPICAGLRAGRVLTDHERQLLQAAGR